MSLLALAVMARWIGPDGFGLSAMAAGIILLVQVPVDHALGEAVVQSREQDDAAVGRLFGCLLLLSLLLWAMLAAAAPAIAAGFGDPRVTAVLRWEALCLPLTALRTVPEAMLMRELRYRALTFASSTSAVAGAAVGIALAFDDRGVWALVWMHLTQALVHALLCWGAEGWRAPRWGLPRLASGLPAYAAQALGVRLLSELDRQLPRILVGAALGSVALGYFALARRVADLSQGLLLVPLQSVALPTLAEARRTDRPIGPLLENAMKVSTLVGYPAVMGLSAVLPLLVPLAFGAQWLAAVLAAQILVLEGLRTAVAGFTSAILRTQGKAHWQIGLSALSVGLTAIGVALAAPHGVVAVAAVVVLRGLITWPIAAWLVQKLGVLPARRQFLIGLRYFLVGAAMYLAVIAVQMIPAWELPSWGQLLLAIGVGASTYILGCLLVARASTLETLRLARHLIER